jgi:hypothetical protein
VTVTITGNITDVTGRQDNAAWCFSSVLRGTDGHIITTRPQKVLPVSGEISVDLEPGPAIITYGDHRWDVTIPDTSTDLWDVIEAAVAFPPDTAHDRLQAAVAALGIVTGAGDPEGVVAAAVGTLYLRSDGAAGTSLYVKESGAGVTGWAAK